MKLSKKFVGALLPWIASSAVACGGVSEGEEFDAVQEPITRGSLVPAGSDPEAVKLMFSSGAVCSGTKIAARRFLTANHCITTSRVNDTVTVTNSDSGIATDPALTITALHKYPTRPANMASGHGTDVGMVDVAQFTPNIPTFSAIRAAHIGTGVTTWLTAYGCDKADSDGNGVPDSTNGDEKQFAAFITEVNPDPPSNVGYIYASGNPKPAVCSGDSGGPLYVKRSDGVWEIGAVVAAGDDNNDSWFTRLNRVRLWITDPAINRFEQGSMGSLLNRNGNNCIATEPFGSITALRFCDLRNVPQDKQYWSLVRIASSNTFNIKNTLNGQCLRASAPLQNGGSVFQGACSTIDTNAQWTFQTPNTADGFTYFHIRNMAHFVGGLCISGGNSSEGTLLKLAPCTATLDAQSFTLIR